MAHLQLELTERPLQALLVIELQVPTVRQFDVDGSPCLDDMMFFFSRDPKHHGPAVPGWGLLGACRVGIQFSPGGWVIIQGVSHPKVVGILDLEPLEFFHSIRRDWFYFSHQN